MDEDFVKIATTDQVPDDEGLMLEVDGLPIALFRVDGKYYAVEDVCPHQESSFEGGELEGEEVTCPLHGWRLNVKTGESLEAPGVKVETYEVRLDGEDIYIRL
ncbi:MAG: Rieske 2Fe-2S domain-containing protein [bacterium]